MEDLIELLPFGASVKVLRNTFFTQEIEQERSKGKTLDEAIVVVAKKTNKGAKTLKKHYYNEPENKI